MLALVVLGGAATTAQADKIDLHVKQLQGGEFKLRLSAALKLSRFRDERAVTAMSRALISDDEPTIRRVAALSLSKMVDESLSVNVRRRAIASLKRARDKDGDSKVRENAASALALLRGLDANPNAKVFLNVARPADLTSSAPRDTPERMHLAVRQTLREYAPAFAQEWPNGKLPTKAQLARNGAKAFFVGTSVAVLDVKKVKGRSEVRCSVSVRVSPWEGSDGKERWQADRTASATGNGKVIGGSSRTGIDNAKRDCVLAVVEQITARQVVPFLQKQAN